MMNQIMLKFWCREHGHVESGFGTAIESVYFNQHGILGLPCPLCMKSRPMLVRLSSRLNDKKGVEIYDGDVVEFRLGTEKCRGVVRYDPESARFVKDILTSYGRERKDLSSYAYSQVVIGNVLDNPRTC